jgi:LysM repeat protein
MTNPKPIYLPPGIDPTQVERPMGAAGCMRYIWLAALFVGLCGGVAIGGTIFSARATPALTATTTITPTPTITQTLRPGVTPTITPTPSATIEQVHIYTMTPTPTISPTEVICWYWHKVNQGETLSGLSAHFGVSIATIQGWNGITNPNRILWGFSIRIKTTCGAATIPPTTAPTQTATIEVF